MGNKGTFGKVLVLAGSGAMCGAAVLCARAVLASGAGMVKVVTEERNRTPLFCALPEAMADFWKEDEPLPEEALLQDLAWADAVVAGPGLSKSRTAKELLVFTVQHRSSSCSGCRCAEPDCRRCRDSFGLPGRKNFNASCRRACTAAAHDHCRMPA